MNSSISYSFNFFSGILLVLTILSACSSNSGNSNSQLNDSVTQLVHSDTAMAASDANWLLQPGFSAGKLQLDEPADSVFKRMGEADAGDAAMGKAVNFWFTEGDKTGYVLSVYTSRDMGNDETARVKRIRVTSPAYKTETGLGTGSSIKDVEQVFALKKQETYTQKGKEFTVYDTDKGIAFEIDAEGRCVAVIIHEPGAAGAGSYLPLRPSS